MSRLAEVIATRLADGVPMEMLVRIMADHRQPRPAVLLHPCSPMPDQPKQAKQIERENRLARITSAAQTRDITIASVVAEFGISRTIARKDLCQLANEGRISRLRIGVYGAAT